MSHRAAVEAASRKRGRTISPEIIQAILESLGPGAIKSISGLPGLFLRAPGKTFGKVVSPFSFEARGRALKKELKAIKNPANISRPSTIAGGERRANIGGQRPPNTELEALALKKQQVQRVAKSDKAAAKERLKARTKFEDRISKLTPVERARFEELSNQLRETIRSNIDKPKRTFEVKEAIKQILDAEPKKIVVLKGLEHTNPIAKAAVKSTNSLILRVPDPLWARVLKIGKRAFKTADSKGRTTADDIEISSNVSSDTIEILHKGKVVLSRTFDKKATKEAIKFLEEQTTKLEQRIKKIGILKDLE